MIRRLLADADLNGAIVSGVVRRNARLDFKRAEEVPLEGLSDEAVLAVAAEDGRVLVSHDITTMPDHFRAYTLHRQSGSHFGLAAGTISRTKCVSSRVL